MWQNQNKYVLNFIVSRRYIPHFGLKINRKTPISVLSLLF